MMLPSSVTNASYNLTFFFLTSIVSLSVLYAGEPVVCDLETPSTMFPFLALSLQTNLYFHKVVVLMGDTWPPGHAPYSVNLEHEVSLQWF